MRIKTVNYWINQIFAEKQNSNKNTKEPQTEEGLMNYQIAEFYISNEVSNNQSKVA